MRKVLIPGPAREPGDLTDWHRETLVKLRDLGDPIPEVASKFIAGEDLSDAEHNTLVHFFAGAKFPQLRDA